MARVSLCLRGSTKVTCGPGTRWKISLANSTSFFEKKKKKKKTPKKRERERLSDDLWIIDEIGPGTLTNASSTLDTRSSHVSIHFSLEKKEKKKKNQTPKKKKAFDRSGTCLCQLSNTFFVATHRWYESSPLVSASRTIVGFNIVPANSCNESAIILIIK